MDAFLTSLLLVALAEIGDKTQLLAFVLAARLRKPLPISAGIFVATVANHPTKHNSRLLRSVHNSKANCLAW